MGGKFGEWIVYIIKGMSMASFPKVYCVLATAINSFGIVCEESFWFLNKEKARKWAKDFPTISKPETRYPGETKGHLPVPEKWETRILTPDIRFGFLIEGIGNYLCKSKSPNERD